MTVDVADLGHVCAMGWARVRAGHVRRQLEIHAQGPPLRDQGPLAKGGKV